MESCASSENERDYRARVKDMLKRHVPRKVEQHYEQCPHGGRMFLSGLIEWTVRQLMRAEEARETGEDLQPAVAVGNGPPQVGKGRAMMLTELVAIKSASSRVKVVNVMVSRLVLSTTHLADKLRSMLDQAGIDVVFGGTLDPSKLDNRLFALPNTAARMIKMAQFLLEVQQRHSVIYKLDVDEADAIMYATAYSTPAERERKARNFEKALDVLRVSVRGSCASERVW